MPELPTEFSIQDRLLLALTRQYHRSEGVAHGFDTIDLAHAVEEPESRVSWHLGRMRSAGLVEKRQRGGGYAYADDFVWEIIVPHVMVLDLMDRRDIYDAQCVCGHYGEDHANADWSCSVAECWCPSMSIDDDEEEPDAA